MNTAAPLSVRSSNTTHTSSGDIAGVTKRLQSELMSLMMANIPGISAFPQSDNLLEWVATLHGPSGTVYEGLVYKLIMTFPASYPYKPPTVKFATRCYHPNVDMSGNICLDILKEKWSAIYNVQTVLLSLQSLLGEPNNDSPLNAQAAQLWNQPEEFRKHVLKHHPGDV